MLSVLFKHATVRDCFKDIRCWDKAKTISIQELRQKNLALCIDAGEYEGVSLFAMKIYEYLPDPASEKEGFLHVIDEDGEHYNFIYDSYLKTT